MLLSIKEMDARKLPFAVALQPGVIDFSGSETAQSGELHAAGVAELIPHTNNEVRVRGKVKTSLTFECDRCLVPADLNIDATFDLLYKPASTAPVAPVRADAKPTFPDAAGTRRHAASGSKASAARAASSEDDDIGIDESDAEVGFYEMPGLELEDILREQVLFALPMQRLCRPECQGICPECGGNRNLSPCHCESHPVNDAWGALKDLHIGTK